MASTSANHMLIQHNYPVQKFLTPSSAVNAKTIHMVTTIAKVLKTYVLTALLTMNSRPAPINQIPPFVIIAKETIEQLPITAPSDENS